MVAISVEVLPGGHLHSDVHQSHRARSHHHDVLRMQMIGVLMPTTTAPSWALRSLGARTLLLAKLRLELMAQPPPKNTGSAAGSRSPT